MGGGIEGSPHPSCPHGVCHKASYCVTSGPGPRLMGGGGGGGEACGSYWLEEEVKEEVRLIDV